MQKTRTKLISLGLAALYFALATAGDALHGLLPCPTGACSDGACAVGATVCNCGHEHFDWRSAKSQASHGSGISWQTSRHGHDASTCAVCGLLGQLKVATSIAAPAAEIASPIAEVTVTAEPVRANSILRLHSVRGPPMLSV